VKEFLSHKGIAYTDKDVSQDEEALQELLKLGFATTPVTIIDGRAVVGFDRQKLEALLGSLDKAAGT